MAQRGKWKWTVAENVLVGAVAKLSPLCWSGTLNLKALMEDIQKHFEGAEKRRDTGVTILFDGSTEEAYISPQEAVQKLQELIKKVGMPSVPKPERLRWLSTSLEMEAVKSSSVIYKSDKKGTFDLENLRTVKVENKFFDKQLLFGVRFCDLELPTVFFTFRGIVNASDWVSNLSFTLGKPEEPEHYEAFKQCAAIHLGFWNELCQCFDELGERLQQLAADHSLRGKKWRLVFTGHSRGGGLAQLMFLYVESGRNEKSLPASLQWLQDADVDLRCVAFGAPSVCKVASRFMESLKSKMVNYVFGNDPVPRCYGWKALIELLEKAAWILSSASRAMAQAAGSFVMKALTACISCCNPILQALASKISSLGLNPSKMFLAMLQEVEKWLTALRDSALEFGHVAQILCIKEIFDRKSGREWLSSFRIADICFKHHDVQNYAKAISLQNKEYRIDTVEESVPEAPGQNDEMQADGGVPMDEIMTDVRRGDLQKATERIEKTSIETGQAEVSQVDVAAGAALLAGFEVKEDELDSLPSLQSKVQQKTKDEKQQDAIKQRLQHQLLDYAKYGNFQKMFHMLEVTDTQLQKEVAARPLGEIREMEIDTKVPRWSAAMQMVFMSASLEDFKKLLRFYPDQKSILNIEEDLQVVKDKLNYDKAHGTYEKRFAERESLQKESGERATPENVGKLLQEIKNGKSDYL